MRVRYDDIARPPHDPLQSDGPAEPSGPPQSSEMDMQVDLPSLTEHGVSADGELAFCRHTSDGLVNCPACVEQAFQSVLAQLDANEASTAEELVSALRDAGTAGLSKRQILVCGSTSAWVQQRSDMWMSKASLVSESVQERTLLGAVRRLTDMPLPLAHWTGYTTPVLVAATHIRPWTVTVQTGTDGHKSIIFPRRWLDIYGHKLSDVWDAAARAVLGLLLLRPGISQVRSPSVTRIAYWYQ